MSKNKHFAFVLAVGLVMVMVAGPAEAATEDKLTASDAAAGDRFGISVSVSGDTAVVGAWADDDGGTDSGSAYVFVGTGGVWAEQAKLTPSDAAADDYFGYCVSVDRDTAIVGGYQNDDLGNSSGSAYIFVRDATGDWSEQQKLTPSDGAAGDDFGFSVSVDADTAVIGAHYDDDNGSSSGSAYVFTRSGGIWTEQQKLTASDAAATDYFGQSISVSGNTVVVAAASNDDAGNSSGSAYVFTRTGGVWTEQQKLTASDAAAEDRFGHSVSVDADTAIVSALYDDDAASASGSAYVFTRSGITWTEQEKLTASDGAADDGFGASVSVSGDTVIVGSRWDDDAGNGSGSAYVFTRTGVVWTEQQKLAASDAVANDDFGQTVSIDGSTAVVGVYLDDDGGDASGSAYVYDITPSDVKDWNLY